MTSILDLGNALMIYCFDTKHILLKIYVDWMIDSTLLELIEELVSFLIYGILMIFR